MRLFPIRKLIECKDNLENNIIHFYFTPDTVISLNTLKSPYIFIVKSGSCRVLVEYNSGSSNHKSRSTTVDIPPFPTSLSKPRVAKFSFAAVVESAMHKAVLEGTKSFHHVSSIMTIGDALSQDFMESSDVKKVLPKTTAMFV